LGSGNPENFKKEGTFVPNNQGECCVSLSTDKPSQETFPPYLAAACYFSSGAVQAREEARAGERDEEDRVQAA
jgi:hypothetical protein